MTAFRGGLEMLLERRTGRHWSRPATIGLGAGLAVWVLLEVAFIVVVSMPMAALAGIAHRVRHASDADRPDPRTHEEARGRTLR